MYIFLGSISILGIKSPLLLSKANVSFGIEICDIIGHDMEHNTEDFGRNPIINNVIHCYMLLLFMSELY